jgi:acyl-CoA synthetase (AMP-forming)/AMP-acid ligase II
MNERKAKACTMERVNLSEHLSSMAYRFPSSPAILYPVRITFRELQDEVDRYAHGLEQAGIARNTRTILLIPPAAEFFILTFALLRVGAVPVMIDPGMGAKAMAGALASVEAEAFIGSSKAHWLRRIYPAAFQTVRTCVTSGSTWFFRGYRLSDLRCCSKGNYSPVSTRPDDPAAIFFTSGSTGIPKGVVYRASMLNAQMELLKTQFMYRPGEIDLCTFPLLGFFSICLGLSLVLADMDTVRPASLDPAKIIANIQQNRCTQMFCSPMVLNRLASYANEKKLKLSSLRRVITAGAPVSNQLLSSFKNVLVREAEMYAPYGATEALPVTKITSFELLRQHTGYPGQGEGICVGRPLEGIKIKIIEIRDHPIASWEEACTLPVNEVGEIVVKGAVVSREYIHLPQADADAKIIDIRNGGFWHRMGDLGRIDEAGMLWYYGRKAHRVKTKNRTLFTIPCEAVFNRHPRVFRSALVGIHNSLSGSMEPVLCVQLEKGDSGRNKKGLTRELLQMGAANPWTEMIKRIYFPGQFPVDARHNAKIYREKLALWVARRVR